MDCSKLVCVILHHPGVSFHAASPAIILEKQLYATEAAAAVSLLILHCRNTYFTPGKSPTRKSSLPLCQLLNGLPVSLYRLSVKKCLVSDCDYNIPRKIKQ